MSYIDDVAAAVRAEVPKHLIPDGDTSGLFLIYAVLALAKGTAVEARDVHDAWAAWMVTRGEPHEAVVEFDDLDLSTRKEDEPFVEAVRRAAIKLGRA